MAILIGIWLFFVLIISVIDLVTIYHFIKFRYEGDLSLFFVTIFIILNLILIALPFILFDYSASEIILPRLVI